MKRINLLLFISIVAVTVIFLAVAFVQNQFFTQKFERAEQAATQKAVEQHQELESFRVRLSQAEIELDSLKRVYYHDSTHWTGQNERLRANLLSEKKNVTVYKDAYESTKKALGKQTLPVDPPDVYDLDPVLQRGDSTRQSTPDQPQPK